MKKVISYSLWGNNQFYTVNCIRNADLAKQFFPDWTCRVYVAPTVPRGIIEALIERGNTEIVYMNEDISWNGMFWRFYAAGDPGVDVMISRDADSLLNIRDKAFGEKRFGNSNRRPHDKEWMLPMPASRQFNELYQNCVHCGMKHDNIYIGKVESLNDSEAIYLNLDNEQMSERENILKYYKLYLKKQIEYGLSPVQHEHGSEK